MALRVLGVTLNAENSENSECYFLPDTASVMMGKDLSYNDTTMIVRMIVHI